MIAKILIEGLILGGVLVLFCAAGIRNGAENMASRGEEIWNVKFRMWNCG